jgi:hypothetical protein
MDPQTPPAEPLDTPPPQLSEKKRSLFIEVLLEACVVVVLIGILLGVFSYFKIISLSSFFKKAPSQTSKTLTVTPTPDLSKQVNLPVSPYLSILDDASIHYTGKTSIASILTLNGAAVIQLKDIQAPGLIFTLDDKTRIAKSSAPTKQINTGEIKKDSFVSFSLTYSLRTKQWTVNSIILLNQ